MFALDAFLHTVADALVGPGERERLLAVGAPLPDAMTGQFGLEVRLGEDPMVDLAVLASTPRQLSILAGHDARIRLPEQLTAMPAWSAAARLADRSLMAAMPAGGVWLEFDVDAEPAIPSPGVFVALDPEAGSGPPRAATATTAVAEILATAGHSPSEQRALVEQVRRATASGLPIRQIGLFPHRRDCGLRAVTSAIPAAPDAAALLARCGWPGSTSSVLTWIGTCARWCDEIHLAMDLTVDGLAPQIGVEAFFAGLPQPRQDPRWAALIGEFERAGLCTPDKGAALLGLGVRYTAAMLLRRRYRQGLHHVKVALHADGHAVAKAYFGTRQACGRGEDEG